MYCAFPSSSVVKVTPKFCGGIADVTCNIKKKTYNHTVVSRVYNSRESI